MSDDEATALTFRRNVIVAASAGTGKTHRLTALYVLLALGLTSMGQQDARTACDPVPLDRIVATTFSRAAALEIRARVERALRGIAAGAGAAVELPFAREIRARMAELADPPSDAELMLRAARALESLHEARIETIHGLCGDLLRRHAVGLGLSPSLRVIEDDEAETLAFGVIDDALARALEGSPEEQQAARGLVDACGGFFRARDALLPFFERLDEEGLDVASLRTSDHLGSALAYRSRLARIVSECAASARESVAVPCQALALALGGAGDAAEPALSELAEAELGRLFAMRKPTKLSPAERELFDLREEFAGTNAQKAKSFAATLAAAHELEDRERAMLALLASVRERLAEERRARGALGFSDLLRLAQDGLRRHPEVAAAAQGEIDALLVDEFQDTSLVQRDLVYLLRERSDRAAARAIDDPVRGADLVAHGLFVVGDRKQSIYGFRGADVAVFNRVCAELGGAVAGAALDLPAASCAPVANADFVALSTSYRSLPGIVSFVNAFSALDFAASSSPAHDVHVGYGPAERLEPALAAGGERVLYIADDGAPVAEPLLAGAGPSLREAFVAGALAHELLADPRGGLSPRDIAVLARRRATIPLVELALGRLGLPYVVAGRALFDTLEVRDMAALVRLVLEPRDRHALAHVLRGPLVALSDAALLELTSERGLPADLLSSAAHAALDPARFPEERARLASFRDRFAELRPSLLRLAAPDALRTAMESFDFDRITAALPRAPSRLGNLDRLIGLAREKSGSLLSFSRWLDHQITNEADEAEAVVFSAEDDAIRLSTIHGAKGLDFPATIVLDLAGREQPGFAALRFVQMPGEAHHRFVAMHRGARGARLDNEAMKESNKQAGVRAGAERARITYVSVTRARRVLALVGSPRNPPRGSMLATLVPHLDGALAGLVETRAASELLAAAYAAPALPVAPAANDDQRELAGASLCDRAGDAVAGELSIATTPLGVFRGCARRFQFRFLLGLEEPVDTGQLDLFEVGEPARERKLEPFERSDEQADPRVSGRAAHRVLEQLPRAQWGAAVADAALAPLLEREGLSAGEAASLAPGLAAFLRGRYAARVGQHALEMHREKELAVVLSAAGAGGPRLGLRGTVDLWARFADGVELIDYKLARPAATLDAYAFQLSAYALALSRVAPGVPVRAGVVFLGGSPEPVWLHGPSGDSWLAAADLAAFEAELVSLAERLARARSDDTWPGVPVAECRRLRCGFITACHRNEPIEVGTRPRRPRRGRG